MPPRRQRYHGPIHATNDGRRHNNRESPPSYSTEPHRNRNDGLRPPRHHHNTRPSRPTRASSPSISDTAGIRRYHERMSPMVISAYKGIQASTTRLKMELETLTNNVEHIAPGDDTIEWSRTPTLIFYVPVPLSWSGRIGRSLSNPEIHLPGHLTAVGPRADNVTEPDVIRVAGQNTNIANQGLRNQPLHDAVANAREQDTSVQPAHNSFNQYREPETNIRRLASTGPSSQPFDPVHDQHRRPQFGRSFSPTQAQAQSQSQPFSYHAAQQQQLQQHQQNQRQTTQQDYTLSLNPSTAQSNMFEHFYPEQADINRIMEQNMRLGHRTQGEWRETSDELDM